MVALEDRFGLSVRSRRMLGWVVRDDERGLPKRRLQLPGASVHRLRAVDPAEGRRDE
jgi:hypothetical protein